MFGMIEIDDFQKFLGEESSKLVAEFNDDYREKIKKIAHDVYEKYKVVDMDELFNAIDSYNRNIISIIAEEAIKQDKVNLIYSESSTDEFEERTTDDVEDMLYEINFGVDYVECFENMIFEATTKYHIPIQINYDYAYEYPTFLKRYSKENGNLLNMIREDIITVEAENPQIIMFEDLFFSGSYCYGAGRVILKKEVNKDGRSTSNK